MLYYTINIATKDTPENTMDIHQQLEARQSRRMAAEDRYLTRMEKREAQAEQLIGELCREGKTVYYINRRTDNGALMGKTREGTRSELIAFLLRNNYA